MTSTIKDLVINLGLFIQHRGMTITEKGKAYAEETFGIKSINKKLYVELCQNDADLESLLYKYLDTLEEILNNRPLVDRALDQAHCTYLTSFFRNVLTMDYRCLLNKKFYVWGIMTWSVSPSDCC